MISKFELRVVGDGVEIVVAVDQAKPCWTMSKNGSSAVNAAYLGSVTICSLVVA
jgi:hypothetical protein